MILFLKTDDHEFVLNAAAAALQDSPVPASPQSMPRALTPAVSKAASTDNDDNYDDFFSDDADDGDDDFVLKTDDIIVRLKTNGNWQTKSLTHDVILLQLLHSRTLLQFPLLR